MKKLGLIILGFIIGAVLTYMFCPREAEEEVTEIEIIKPKGVITVEEAKILSKNWERNNATEIDSLIQVEGSKKKTRSVWWSLKDFNDYLAYAKVQSDSLGYKMTGVRVYLGNYGNISDPIKKNRNTMFIVPTGNKITSKASTIGVFFPPADDDIPSGAFNDGVGGNGGYPN